MGSPIALHSSISEVDDGVGERQTSGDSIDPWRVEFEPGELSNPKVSPVQPCPQVSPNAVRRRWPTEVVCDTEGIIAELGCSVSVVSDFRIGVAHPKFDIFVLDTFWYR